MPLLSIKRLLRKTFRALRDRFARENFPAPLALTPSLGRHAAALNAVAASAATRHDGDAQNQAPATRRRAERGRTTSP